MRKGSQPKLKTFSCGFFRQCTQTVLSPTTTAPPPLPQAPPPSPPPPHITQARQPNESSSSSSSNSASQSFTQWKFPLANSPPPPPPMIPSSNQNKQIHEPPSPPIAGVELEELYHEAEMMFESGLNPARVEAVRALDRALTSGTRATACPAVVVAGITACLRDGVAPRSASKVLLALCLEVENRLPAVEAGAVSAVVEALTDADADGTAVERSLAALELLCTTKEGADDVREHALAVPMMVQVMGRADGRGKEHAISVLTVIYGGLEDAGTVAPPREVARAVMLALQGECSARGRRKGGQLLKILQGNGRLDLD